MQDRAQHKHGGEQPAHAAGARYTRTQLGRARTSVLCARASVLGARGLGLRLELGGVGGGVGVGGEGPRGAPGVGGTDGGVGGVCARRQWRRRLLRRARAARARFLRRAHAGGGRHESLRLCARFCWRLRARFRGGLRALFGWRLGCAGGRVVGPVAHAHRDLRHVHKHGRLRRGLGRALRWRVRVRARRDQRVVAEHQRELGLEVRLREVLVVAEVGGERGLHVPRVAVALLQVLHDGVRVADLEAEVLERLVRVLHRLQHLHVELRLAQLVHLHLHARFLVLEHAQVVPQLAALHEVRRELRALPLHVALAHDLDKLRELLAR